MRAIADDGEIGLDVLVDRGRVDVDVDLLRSRREGVEPAGDPIVEARADGDHQIAIVHRPVGFPGAVHAKHAEPLLIGGREGAEPHQRRGDGKAGELHELAQQLARGRAGIDHAAAGVKQRTFGHAHHVDGLLDPVEVALDLRPIAAVLKLLRLGIGALGELDVLRDVDHDRPRPSARGDVESLMQRARQILNGFDQIIVFGARPSDADGVAFLEGVIANQMRRHLPGENDDRDRVTERISEARDRIGGARSGSDEDGANLASRARITLGGVHGTLLVPHQDVVDFILLEQRIVDRQHRAAGIAENMLHALIG